MVPRCDGVADVRLFLPVGSEAGMHCVKFYWSILELYLVVKTVQFCFEAKCA